MMKWIAAAVMMVALAPRAEAFCGFYVNGAGGEMFNDATQVVLMRQGTRTVLSMQNNYQGPPEAFALVIPVPTVLHKEDVKTLPHEVFARIDQLGSPRLVEYWEMDPCYVEPEYKYDKMAVASGAIPPPPSAPTEGGFGVKIEAQFEVGEYQIVILSAKDSTGLDGWLRAEHYQIPAGAEPYLRPYVEAGMKFFVAKVDPAKVKFDDDHRAKLSPLRFHYDSEEFNLPIRLGLANSSGTQDLIVDILAPAQRYEVANYRNVTIPTNLDVKDSVREKFGEFYAALFDRTLEKNPGSVVTEYAWTAGSCDPCPGPSLDPSDIATLGGDVLGQPIDPWSAVLTRLHARYGKDIKDDLVFKQATPIVGGREFLQENGKLEERSRPDSTNNFQARYAIRHEWTGPIKCDKPVRGRWGGPPNGVSGGGIKAAQDLAFAPRGKAALPELVRQDIPEIDVKVAQAGAPATDRPATPVAPPPTTPPPSTKQAKAGCGCEAGSGSDLAAGGLLALGVLAGARRRPSTSRSRRSRSAQDERQRRGG